MNLNNNDPPRNRGIELLLYKRSRTNPEKSGRKFVLKKVISFFNKEYHFNFELSIVNKNVSLGE